MSLLLTISEYLIVLLAIIGFSTLSYLIYRAFYLTTYYLKHKNFPLTLEEEKLIYTQQMNIDLKQENAKLKQQLEDIQLYIFEQLKG